MKEYPKGMWFNQRDRAPDFVIGNISISKKSFLAWLDQREPNEKGNVHLDVLKGKEGPYVCVSEYKAGEVKTPTKPEENNEQVRIDDVPF